MPIPVSSSAFPVPPLLINPSTSELQNDLLLFSPPMLKVSISSKILTFPISAPSHLEGPSLHWEIKSYQRIDLKTGSILELLLIPYVEKGSNSTSTSSSYESSVLNTAFKSPKAYYYPLAFPSYNIDQLQGFVDNCMSGGDLVKMGRVNVARDGFDFVCLVQGLKRVEAEYQHIYETTFLSNPGLFKSLALLPSSSTPISQPNRLSPSQYPLVALSAQKKLMSLSKRLCQKLNITSIGIGPPKTVDRALSKSSQKYNGDITRVLDWCRCVVVCPTPEILLAAVLLIRSRCSKTLVRLKTDSLINDPLIGGYRHVVVNFDLGGHIGELCLTTEEMWSVCKTRGSRHYFHCRDLGSDSLRNVDSVVLGVGAEERGDMIQDVEARFGKLLESDGNWTEYQTNVILALTRLLIHSGFDRWASLNLRKILQHFSLVNKDSSNPNVLEVKRILVRCLTRMAQHEEAEEIAFEVQELEEKLKVEVHCVSRVANVSVNTFQEMVIESRKAVAQKVQEGQDPKTTREYKFLAEEGLAFRRELAQEFPFLCIDDETGREMKGVGKGEH